MQGEAWRAPLDDIQRLRPSIIMGGTDSVSASRRASHSMPGFTLYNVSGLDAVELKLKSGETRGIGTGDPQGLAAALRSAAHTGG